MTEQNQKKPEAANKREKELIQAIFSTPQGKELIGIWEDRLINVAVWDRNLPEDVCRHIGGRHSVYRDLIRIAKKGP